MKSEPGQDSEDAVEKMQQKLEELQREIIEVMDQHQAEKCHSYASAEQFGGSFELDSCMQDKLQEQEEKSSPQDAHPMPALTDTAALTEAEAWQLQCSCWVHLDGNAVQGLLELWPLPATTRQCILPKVRAQKKSGSTSSPVQQSDIFRRQMCPGRIR